MICIKVCVTLGSGGFDHWNLAEEYYFLTAKYISATTAVKYTYLQLANDPFDSEAIQTSGYVAKTTSQKTIFSNSFDRLTCFYLSLLRYIMYNIPYKGTP